MVRYLKKVYSALDCEGEPQKLNPRLIALRRSLSELSTTLRSGLVHEFEDMPLLVPHKEADL